MRPSARIKLVSQFLDLPLIDCNDRWCGVVDDIEFEGSVGGGTRISTLLVGPGAYAGRMPQWMYRIVQKVAGERIARVPIGSVAKISSAVHLRCAAEDLKLHVVEDKVRRWIPRLGAL
jgi:hypothetical protein